MSKALQLNQLTAKVGGLTGILDTGSFSLVACGYSISIEADTKLGQDVIKYIQCEIDKLTKEIKEVAGEM